MKIKEAGVFDLRKINRIIVDDRTVFDNPIFVRGIAPKYSTWLGIKPIVKYLIAVIHPRKRLFFAVENDDVVGVLVISNRNFIDGFFINSEYRRKGFGKMLMNHVCSLVKKKSGTIHVGVQSVNEDAMRFYKNCGFKVNEYILNKELR